MRPLSFTVLASFLYALSVWGGHELYQALLTPSDPQPWLFLVRLVPIVAVFVWTAWATPDRRVVRPVALSWTVLWMLYLLWSGALKAPQSTNGGQLFGYVVGIVGSLLVIGLLHWGILLGLRWLLERLGWLRPSPTSP